ncbi:Panacea domain-containing protein [Agrobacterium rosae]|uniref:Putative phage-associated protein n=1 Tax=Agrobacterium rosae TaxID=1972867 RepID=A0A1R3TSY0_9HYPH|nr:type II toxin-antitoxin system antitoxin SocA domain-containing protein [Agrobacterium rosae]SCX25478.1 putative phage-associated protein [Agrobacterium rosae]
MFDARLIANEILLRAWKESLELTQIDIQKILYFLHGHHLIEHDFPLIKSEFEAWEYGPVQRIVYDQFKNYGDSPITELAERFDPISRQNSAFPRLTDNSAVSTIEQHLYKYLEVPSFSLVDITHRPGTPWSRTIEAAKERVNVGMRIKNDLIRSYFEGFQVA